VGKSDGAGNISTSGVPVELEMTFIGLNSAPSAREAPDVRENCIPLLEGTTCLAGPFRIVNSFELLKLILKLTTSFGRKIFR
jgi:hypothetical protein